MCLRYRKEGRVVTGWLRSYGLMVKWQGLSNRPMWPLIAAVEVMIAIGFIIGLGFLFPQIDPVTAKFLTTGAPTLILLTVGLVLVPQMVAMARTEGTFDYIWSLPVPRMVFLAADATIWILVSLPGVVLALVIGAFYYDFGLEVSPLVVPGLLLVGISGILLGYAIAHGAPKPEMAHLVTQILVFAIMLFSPVLYSIDQLPGWLATLHRGLPIQYMADLSRGTLTDLDVNLGLAFAVVGAWCALGLFVTWALVRRRR
jgi:ABC-2 type transport system permease protein